MACAKALRIDCVPCIWGHEREEVGAEDRQQRVGGTRSHRALALSESHPEM